MSKEACSLCGHDKFNKMDGFYFCNGCGSQSQALREFESDPAQSVVGLKKTKITKPPALQPGKSAAPTAKNDVLTERAFRAIDFPSYLMTLGYRLCTFTKLIVKISHMLVADYRVPEDCKKHSLRLYQEYFRKFGCAFCNGELGGAGEELFEPLIQRTDKEITALKAEAKRKAVQTEVERKTQRLSQYTVFGAITQEEEEEKLKSAANNPSAEVDVMNQVHTKIGVNALKAAAVIYLEIDLILLIVYVSAQLAGCRWIQISDLFRWYREGRFGVSKSQIRALYPSTDYKGRETTFRITRRSFYHFDGVQPQSQNLRVMAFLTQFIGVPKSLHIMDFSTVLLRTVYNLGLPTAFVERVELLCQQLPAVNIDHGALSFGEQLPIFSGLRERLLERGANATWGPSGFLNQAFDDKTYQGKFWELLPLEVKAMALVLFALKLCFGLDDSREFQLEPVEEESNAQFFSYRDWFLQLKLRLNVWRDKPIEYVLSQGFESMMNQRTAKCLRIAKEQNSSQRFTKFQKCVPNYVRFPRPERFGSIFHDEQRVIGKSGSDRNASNSNDALYAPLRYQAIKHEEFYRRYLDGGLNDQPDDDRRLDAANVELFFTSFADHRLELRPASGSASVETPRKRRRVDLSVRNPIYASFPCANFYKRVMALNGLKCLSPHHAEMTGRPGMQPSLERTMTVELYEASKFHHSKSFADLLQHLAVVVGEQEETLFFAFAMIEAMVIDNVEKLEAQFRSGKWIRFANPVKDERELFIRLLNTDAPVRNFSFDVKKKNYVPRVVKQRRRRKHRDRVDELPNSEGEEELSVEYDLNTGFRQELAGDDVVENEFSAESDDDREVERDENENKGATIECKLPYAAALNVLSFKYW